MCVVTKESNPELYNALFPEDEIIQDKYEEIIFYYLANNCSEFDDEHIKHLVDLKVEQYNQLKSQLQQKENIIKEAREYIDNHQLVFELSSKKQIKEWFGMFYKELLEILDKEKK